MHGGCSDRVGRAAFRSDCKPPIAFGREQPVLVEADT
jgi:hypothetical protein